MGPALCATGGHRFPLLIINILYAGDPFSMRGPYHRNTSERHKIFCFHSPRFSLGGTTKRSPAECARLRCKAKLITAISYMTKAYTLASHQIYIHTIQILYTIELINTNTSIRCYYSANIFAKPRHAIE